MPTKGFFTQAVAILFSEAVTLEELDRFLIGFTTEHVGSKEKKNIGGPAICVEFRPQVNGYVLVDVEHRPWPDGMGDPKSEIELFAAWSMGNFGPYAFPGGLRRAAEHWWVNPQGRGKVPEHCAFVRLRMSYVLGAGSEVKIMPEDCDPAEELNFLNRLVLALMDHPNALFYFNANGETLRDRQKFAEEVEYHEKAAIPPLALWTNVRMFNFNEAWMLMDTVGMEQLDLPDLEACFPKEAFEGSAIDYFFRNCSLYLLQNGEVIENGNTMDGPGDIRWRACVVKDPLAMPPRRVLRWFPTNVKSIPRELLPDASVEKVGAGIFGGIKKLLGR